jgi:transcriptional regulator with XRE-family HTH domain
MAARAPLQLADFGAALRKAREERGSSVANMSKSLAVSKDDVRAWEAGHLAPSKLELKQLLAFAPELRRFEADLRAENYQAAPQDVEVPEPVFKTPPLPPAVVVTPAPRPKTFGVALRAARLAADVTQDAIAQLTGNTQATVSAWELDEVCPVLENYEKLVDLFPELRDAPAPDSKDIDKPPGPAGMSFAVVRGPSEEPPARAPIGTRASPQRFSPAAEPPPPLEEPPMPESSTPASAIPIEPFLRWTQASASLRIDAQTRDTLRDLLKAAGDLGLSLEAVAQALDALKPAALLERLEKPR